MLKSFASGEFKGMFKDGFVSYESLNSEERIHFAAEFEFFFLSPTPSPQFFGNPPPPQIQALILVFVRYLSQVLEHIFA